MRAFLIAPLILVACTATDFSPRPDAVRLGRAFVEVTMTDGTTCCAELAGPAPWAGDLPGCGLRYRVTPTGGDSPIRLAFDQFVAAIRAGDILAPMADIILTDAKARVSRFTSPVPLED